MLCEGRPALKIKAIKNGELPPHHSLLPESTCFYSFSSTLRVCVLSRVVICGRVSSGRSDLIPLEEKRPKP